MCVYIYSTWRTDSSNHTENRMTSRSASIQNLTTHPLSASKYPQPSIADYQSYPPTRNLSTKLSPSTTKPSDQVESTKYLTTARETLPHLQKETSSGLTPIQQKWPNQSRYNLPQPNKEILPTSHLHPVFNKNNVKVSYSCMLNMGIIISNHNERILNNTTPQNGCNCRKKDQCLLNNNCLITSVLCKANVTTDTDDTGENYIELTEGTFKQRYTQRKQSFRNGKYATRNELAKHIWKIKDKKVNFKISWSIISSASAIFPNDATFA